MRRHPQEYMKITEIIALSTARQLLSSTGTRPPEALGRAPSARLDFTRMGIQSPSGRLPLI